MCLINLTRIKMSPHIHITDMRMAVLQLLVWLKEEGRKGGWSLWRLTMLEMEGLANGQPGCVKQHPRLVIGD